MRLIDADAFLKRNEVYADCEFLHPMYQNTLREIVDDEPTIDAVPVAHGEWEVISVAGTWFRKVRCSCCKEERIYATNIIDNYCPNCGARMGELREG